MGLGYVESMLGTRSQLVLRICTLESSYPIILRPVKVICQIDQRSCAQSCRFRNALIDGSLRQPLIKSTKYFATAPIPAEKLAERFSSAFVGCYQDIHSTPVHSTLLRCTLAAGRERINNSTGSARTNTLLRPRMAVRTIQYEIGRLIWAAYMMSVVATNMISCRARRTQRRSENRSRGGIPRARRSRF